MTDPVRWLEGGGDLTPEERRVLGADQGRGSPLGAKAAILGVLAAKVSVSATAGAATAASGGVTAAKSGVAASLTALSLAKIAGMGLALGTVVSTGLYLGGNAVTVTAPSAARASHAVSSGRVPSEKPALTQRAEANAADEPAEPEAAPVAATGRAASRPDAARAEADAPSVTLPPLENESQRVARARALLRSGDAPRALGVLRALERDEPSGLLAQEREALLIEGLVAVGQRDSAQKRATAFLARYPTSPHAAAVRRALP